MEWFHIMLPYHIQSAKYNKVMWHWFVNLKFSKIQCQTQAHSLWCRIASELEIVSNGWIKGTESGITHVFLPLLAFGVKVLLFFRNADSVFCVILLSWKISLCLCTIQVPSWSVLQPFMSLRRHRWWSGVLPFDIPNTPPQSPAVFIASLFWPLPHHFSTNLRHSVHRHENMILLAIKVLSYNNNYISM